MCINAGDMIRVPANFVKPVKPKYMICVCAKNHFYMVINTLPYMLAASAQLQVTLKDIPGLEHTSHVDTSKLVRLTKMETVNVVQADKRCHKGHLSKAVKDKIKAIIKAHGIMPGDQEKLIQANF